MRSLRGAGTSGEGWSSGRTWLLVVYPVVAIGLLWFGHWSSQPWLPNGSWYLQRTPVRGWSDPHSGVLNRASVNAVDMPSDRIGDTLLVRGLRRGEATLELVETVGPPTRRLAYLVRLVHADARAELLAIARDGNALVLHRLSNAARLNLSAAGVRVPNVYADLSGRTVTWQLQLARGELRLRAEAGDGASHASRSTPPITREYALPAPSALRGWGALLPSARDFTPNQLRLLDFLWACALTTPLLGGVLGGLVRGWRRRTR